MTYENGVSFACKWENGIPEGKLSIYVESERQEMIDRKSKLLQTFHIIQNNSKTKFLEGDVHPSGRVVNLGIGPYQKPQILPLPPTLPHFDLIQYPAAQEPPY
eukprot:TRINITY_DN1811_c0_g2_i1.p1 TRINITY_DN1811_c0_g2~~TRINITY_DN1811_c0_g2_i1.p1  ORF type:complete len:103 (+),score=13.08 TRINITY_DN1811_c0_g2_i1:166-474(+)